MDRHKFQALRDIEAKEISEDIKFEPKRLGDSSMAFSDVQVQNGLDVTVILSGRYNPRIPSLTFNFYVPGIGPICRLDVNGQNHKDVGRYHKHDLRRDSDPRNNLPSAIQRDDLKGMAIKDIWEMLCEQANIKHTGRFFAPDYEDTNSM